MDKSNDLIGKTVFCVNLGKGIISDIKEIDGHNNKFFVVESSNKNIKNFFPINNNNTLRFLADKNEFDQSLKILEDSKIKKQFTTKKEQIKYFQAPLDKPDLKNIAIRAAELNSVEDLNALESKTLDKYIDTMALEGSILLNMKTAECKKMILNHLNR